MRHLAVIGEMHSVINFLELFIYQQGRAYRQGQADRLVHFLVVRFDIWVSDIPIWIKKMLKNILSRDSEESGVLISQLLKVIVFYCDYDLVLEVFLHCDRILVDYLPFIMLKLDLFS